MKVNKIVVHSLLKNENQQKASVDLSHDLLFVDDESTDLVKRLNSSYRKLDITNAIFDDTGKKVFSKEFESYSRSNTDKTFLHFSQKAVENLMDKIEKIAPAKGGFIVFADYEDEAREYISVYLIRDTTGMLFKKDKASSSFVINPTTHLDLDKLAMACRINLLRYRANDGKYLSFIKRKMENISAYFIDWIAAIETESNKIYTDHLYKLSNQAKLPVDDKGKTITRDTFRTKIYDYVKAAPGKVININALSKHFYSDETYLSSLAETNNLTIDTEFQSDIKEMKKFVRVEIAADGVTIRFSRNDYPSKVRVGGAKSNVVMIESEELAKALLEEVE